jgi:multidrug efflux pump subunit AcrA (membrane-fusion protein)
MTWGPAWYEDAATAAPGDAAPGDAAGGSGTAPGSNGNGAGAELNGSGSAESDRLKESNGSTPSFAPIGSASVARPVSSSPGGPARHRGRQMTLTVLLALACAAGAVLSVRAFVLTSTNRFPAVIQPTQALSLDFPELGHLSSLSVRPGDHVRVGEILARLDPVGAHAEVLAATAAVAAVAADRETLTATRQDVTAQAAVEQASVARAKARLAADQARLAQAQLALEQATIRSPVNGLVMNVSGEVGDLVGPVGVQMAGSAQPIVAQTPAFSPFPQASQRSATATRGATTPLIQLAAGPIRVEAQVSESAVGGLRPGRRATVTVPALGASLGARLLRVVPDPVQTAGGVSYGVLFNLLRPSPQVLPGMSADVTLGR